MDAGNLDQLPLTISFNLQVGRETAFQESYVSGAAALLGYVAATVTNLTVANHRVFGSNVAGGGLYLLSSNVSISNSYFINTTVECVAKHRLNGQDSCSGTGGVIFSFNGSLTIRNSEFKNSNMMTQKQPAPVGWSKEWLDFSLQGGAVFGSCTSEVSIEDSTFDFSFAKNGGAVFLHLKESCISAVIRNTTIS